ncbi:MAG: hypothetical protein INR70_29635 [Parafilimonas terrae]|nr:hypothetical protein [Parafilimonas terrae]
MTLSLVLSTALALVTGAAALLWAGLVAPKMDEFVDAPSIRDLRTW